MICGRHNVARNLQNDGPVDRDAVNIPTVDCPRNKTRGYIRPIPYKVNEADQTAVRYWYHPGRRGGDGLLEEVGDAGVEPGEVVFIKHVVVSAMMPASS